MTFIQSDYANRSQHRFGIFDNHLKNINLLSETKGELEGASSFTPMDYSRFYRAVKTPAKRLEELMWLTLRTSDDLLRTELLDLILNLIKDNKHLVNHLLKHPGVEYTPVELAIKHHHIEVANELLSIGKNLGYKENHLIKDPSLRFKFRSHHLGSHKHSYQPSL